MFESIKKTAMIAVFTLATTLSGQVFAGGEGWSHDYKSSLDKATKEKKDVILDFTGSDWCGWCIKLNKEVFSQDAFKSTIPNTFVLVEIDFPRDKSKMTKETIAQNDTLKNKFSISGYPTIYLADHTGKAYAKTGYQAGGTEVYNKHLLELQSRRIQRDELLAIASKLKGIDKARKLDEVITLLGDDLMWAYKDVVNEIIALDADGKAGLKDKYQIKEEIKSLKKFIRGQKHAEAIALADNLLGRVKNKETRQDILFGKSQTIYYQKGDFLSVLQLAYDAAPESQMAPRIKQIMGALKKQAEINATKEAKTEAEKEKTKSE